MPPLMLLSLLGFLALGLAARSIPDSHRTIRAVVCMILTLLFVHYYTVTSRLRQLMIHDPVDYRDDAECYLHGSVTVGTNTVLIVTYRDDPETPYAFLYPPPERREDIIKRRLAGLP